MVKKNAYLANFASLVGGGLLTLAFAPFAIFPFALIALAGLILLTANTTPQQAGTRGFWFGMGLFSTGVYWVYISISRYGDVPAPVAFLITALMMILLSGFPAVACYLANRYFSDNERTRTLFAFPALWTLVEWARCWLFTGFPWLMVGYSQTNSPLKGYAPIFSVYGVSLAVAFSSGLLVQTYREFQNKQPKQAYFNLMGLTTLWVAGALLALIPWTAVNGKAIKVGLIQGDIPQSLKWDPDHIELSLTRYAQYTKPLLGNTQLVVWPEAAIPLALNDALGYLGEVSAAASHSNTALIVGIPIQNANTDNYFNALISLGKDKQTYFKRQLVPFGEYVPFKHWLARGFDFMHVPMANMLPGNANQSTMHVAGLNIDASICYEIAFPELIRTNNRDVNLLLTVTNDAWFGHSTAQAQHLQMASMRAIELARPLLFVSNDGITAVINPNGLIEAAAPAHVPAILKADVQPRVGLTPWMKNGTDPILVLLLFFLYLAKRYSAPLNTTAAMAAVKKN